MLPQCWVLWRRRDKDPVPLNREHHKSWIWHANNEKQQENICCTWSMKKYREKREAGWSLPQTYWLTANSWKGVGDMKTDRGQGSFFRQSKGHMERQRGCTNHVCVFLFVSPTRTEILWRKDLGSVLFTAEYPVSRPKYPLNEWMNECSVLEL